jgi:peptidoglycan-associated lipoprotein
LPAPTITLRADSATIAQGGTLTLTWESRNAATVDIQPGIGSVTPVGTGSRQVTPGSSVTYTATATGPGGSAQDVLRITVNAPPPPPAPVTGGGVVAPPTPNLTAQQLFEKNMQPIIFDYDKADIREDQKGKLQTAATYLKSNPNVRLVIEGHTDERGSEEYNLALGDRRANAVKQGLLSQGIAESRLSSVSYGEERPVCSAATEDCYAQNRRAAFRINP